MVTDGLGLITVNIALEIEYAFAKKLWSFALRLIQYNNIILE